MARCLTCVLFAIFAAPMLAVAQPAPSMPGFHGPTTTPSGSYLNLAPRRRPAPRPLVQPASPVPSRDAETRRPRVVCGMRVIEGDAGLDPGMTARTTPLTARPAVRAVTPPICDLAK